MRRLESLSNTIFGVAMTLLAYDLPKAGAFESAPTWTDLYQLYAGRLSGLILSFIIAAPARHSHRRDPEPVLPALDHPAARDQRAFMAATG
jgi:hypothetical protein